MGTGKDKAKQESQMNNEILISGVRWLVLEEKLVESPGFLPQVGKKPIESKPFSYVAITVERV